MVVIDFTTRIAYSMVGEGVPPKPPVRLMTPAGRLASVGVFLFVPPLPPGQFRVPIEHGRNARCLKADNITQEVADDRCLGTIYTMGWSRTDREPAFGLATRFYRAHRNLRRHCGATYPRHRIRSDRSWQR